MVKLHAYLIGHQGKHILYWDFHGLQGNALIDGIQEAIRFSSFQQETAALLVDVRETIVSSEAMVFVRSAEMLEELRKFQKVAWVGVDGLKQILFNTVNSGINRKMRTFATEQAAKDFLVV